MTKAQHTPGPWILQPASWIMANGDAIATVASAGNNTGHNYHATGETLANARLIAAAPELLEMLLVWQEFAANNGWTDADHKDNNGGWISRTDAAITKARGEG